jgi:DNA primase
MGATRIPEDTVEKIRKAADIVDVINDYVQLKKQGRNYFGLCPFHGENTPSFSVSPDKQIYHCFGCGAGGNAFSFLMEIEGFQFPEAVRHLGEKVGIYVPQLEQSSANQKSNRDREVMQQAHELLAKLYHHCLLNTNQGQQALAYLKNRGFDEETIKTYKLGYAPDSWEFASAFLEKRGFQLEKVEQAGLIAKREFDGKYFDRFRNRIMFPIWDAKGNTIGFGGRVLGEGEPKYLNSPETKIFNKSKTLYGFHLARPQIRLTQQAVLFEGYVDVTSAWRAGVRNGVATLGTSLTEEQAKILSRNADSITICYDSDNAGVNAAFRAAEMFAQTDCLVKIAKMPDGLDPDDYIRKYGAETFLTNVIGTSLTIMSFKMDYFRRGKNLQDEGERMQYIEEVLQEISSLKKAVERDHYLRQLANEFSLSLDALKQQQYQFYKQLQKNQDKPFEKRDNKARKSFYVQRLLPAFHNAERLLLAHMLRNIEIAEKVQEEIGGAFNIEEYSAVAAYLYAYYAQGNQPDVSAFLESLNEPQLIRTASELAMLEVNEDISDKVLEDYINQVLIYPKKMQIEEKEKEKKEAERRQDFLTAAKIAMEIIEMKKTFTNK